MLAHSSTVQSSMAGKTQQQEGEAAGHMEAERGKVAVSWLSSLSAHGLGWECCYPPLEHAFLSTTIKVTKIVSTYISRG